MLIKKGYFSSFENSQNKKAKLAPNFYNIKNEVCKVRKKGNSL
jgi:hypothetical protein